MKFKDVYQFTFNYAKNQGQKGLDLEMAVAYWNIILRGRFKFLDLWCNYLQVFLNSNVNSIEQCNMMKRTIFCQNFVFFMIKILTFWSFGLKNCEKVGFKVNIFGFKVKLFQFLDQQSIAVMNSLNYNWFLLVILIIRAILI